MVFTIGNQFGKKPCKEEIKIKYSKNKELRCEVSNGITLCCDCHKKIHKNK